MSDERKIQRVEKLLAVSQAQERAAQQAFDLAKAAADDVQAKIIECERAMIERHEQFRQHLAGGTLNDLAGGYRDGVSSLRRQIAHLTAVRKLADSHLEDRRADLLAAMTRRRAAEIARERLAARQAAAQGRRETRLLDETHAAVMAAGGAWRGQAGRAERKQK